MNKFILGFICAMLIVGVVYGAYSLGKNQQLARQKIETPQITQTPTASQSDTRVGADKDEHGCIGSAGYSWCEAKKKCLRPWEEKCEEDITGKIKQALMKKNNWPDSMELDISISSNDGVYAKGTVKEKDSMAGGGYFFAAKVDSEWKIVADGNGVITCESVSPYPSYPASLLPECWDQKTDKIIKR